MSQALLIPGVGRLPFAAALRLLQPYSPRLAVNFQNPTGSLCTDASRTAQVAAVGDRIRSFTNQVTGQPHGAASSDAKSPLWARYPSTGRRNRLVNSALLGTVSGNPGGAPTGWTAAGTDGTITYDAVAESVRFEVIGNRRNFTQILTFEANKTYQVWALCNVTVASSIHQIFDVVSLPAGTTVSKFQDGNPLTISQVVSPGNGTVLRLVITTAGTAGTGNFGFGGGVNSNSTSDVTFLRVQVEEAASPTNYQRVVTAADITEAGVQDVRAAMFDGADDCLQVAGFDLSDTDKVTVIAGVRRLSGNANAIAETGTNFAQGRFTLDSATTGANAVRFGSAGSITQTAIAVPFPAPSTDFFVGVGDIGGDLVRLIRNGIQIAINNGDQGSGNFQLETLNIGGRNDSSTIPFNGYIHYLFICGAIVPDGILTRIYRGLGPRIGLTA